MPRRRREELQVEGAVRRLTFTRCLGGGHLAFFEIHHEKSGGIMPAIVFPDAVRRLRGQLFEGAMATFLGHFSQGQDADGHYDWKLDVSGILNPARAPRRRPVRQVSGDR